MARNYLSLTGALLGSALLVLTACSSDSDDEDTSAPEPTMTTVETTSAPDVTDVDPEAFEMDGRHVFDVPMGDDTTSLCIMVDSSVTCNGKPPEDAPDIEISPFPVQRPGAVSLDGDGLTWTMVEGVPPAPGKLEPSQRISDGDVTCETDASGSLDCVNGDNGFAINYEDAAISVRGTVMVTEVAEPTSPQTSSAYGGVDGDYRSTDEPVEARI